MTNTENAENPAGQLPVHPFLYQDSYYSTVHYNASQSDISEYAYGRGERVVTPEQLKFAPGGLNNGGHAHRRYADGREAIIASGSARVAKYRFDGGRLELINELRIEGGESEYMSAEDLEQLVADLDRAGTGEDQFLAITQAVVNKTGYGSETLPNGMYTLMDHEGYFYAGYGTTLYKFGDAEPGDADSDLKVIAKCDLKERLPADLASEVSRFLGINMTYDGYVVVALSGMIGVIDRTFENWWYTSVPGEAIDNGVVVDVTDGVHGIYVVTSQYMRKLVWTGSALSMEKADGAWKEPYDWVRKENSFSRGSGTTPTLMGYGPDADRLVLIADQGDPVKVVAFWRDEIPKGAKKVKGAKSKRTAGSIAISFPVRTTIEWSPYVHGYGTMFLASEFMDPVLLDGEIDIFSTMLTIGQTRPAPKGAEKFVWNPETREFERKWCYDKEGLSWSLSPISTSENVVYLNTIKEGVYKMVGLDWESGEPVGAITLGKSVKFNVAGTFLSPLPDGSLYIHGLFGPIRIADIVG